MKRAMGLVFACLWLLSGCRQYVKVPVEYRRAPLIENLSERTLLVGRIINHCRLFDASSDLENTLEEVIRKEKVFKTVKRIPPADAPLPSLTTLEDATDDVEAFDWRSWREKHPGDYLIMSEIHFNSENHSGYESVWRVNRAGFRYPAKVWRDKMAYNLELRFVLIDLATGKIAADKTYTDHELVEGAADEVGAFMAMADIKTRAFLDYLLGKKIKSYRFLLYR